MSPPPPLARTIMLRASTLFIAIGLCAAGSAGAQEAFGTLRLLDSGTPASGVVVLASLAANDSTVGRTITGARGTYVLRVPSAPIVLRVLRVGQQPFELARLTLEVGARQEVSATLPNVPVRLAMFDARFDSRCRVDPVNRTLVAQLFDEARKALWASQLATMDSAGTSLFQNVVQRFDTRERAVGSPIINVTSENTLRPFSSTNVDSLLEHGFRQLTNNREMIYHAPDAEVLTSDRFLAHYCLKLNTDSVSNPGWRGVSFEPVRARRGVVQVRGTVWLDRTTNELRRIDYGYSGLEPMLARATPGGVVEYTSLPEGIWFVHEWSIRMPIVSRFARQSRGSQELDYFTAVNGIQVTSGQVLELRDGDNLLFSSGVSRDSVTLVSAAPLIALRDTTNCDTLSTTLAASAPPPAPLSSADTLATLTGVLRDAQGQPMAGVLVRATWTEMVLGGDVELRTGRYSERVREVFTHTGLDGVFHLCDLPRRQTLSVVAGPAERSFARTEMRIRYDLGHAKIALTARRDRVPEPE